MLERTSGDGVVDGHSPAETARRMFFRDIVNVFSISVRCVSKQASTSEKNLNTHDRKQLTFNLTFRREPLIPHLASMCLLSHAESSLNCKSSISDRL